ncbi:MAG: hypothetical protein MZV63_30650 [Marinilabiliales bacterium]|nr:hypothetical protein [Marinilabiliales bacterium]
MNIDTVLRTLLRRPESSTRGPRSLALISWPRLEMVDRNAALFRCVLDQSRQRVRLTRRNLEQICGRQHGTNG